MKKMKFLKFSLIFLLGIGFVIPFSAISQTVETFTTSGSWVCPAGVTSVKVECWGGGGGGGRRGTIGASGGGGGGAYASSTITVIPGTSYSINIGAAGAGANPATAGGDTYFNNNSTVMAKGGSPVANNTNTGASGGLASNSVGVIKFNGGTGGTSSGGNIGGGGGGAAGPLGVGGDGSAPTGGTGGSPGGNGGAGRSGSEGVGIAGQIYGGGGGGAYKSSTNYNGGAGGSGYLRITYYCSPAPTSVDGSGITNITFGTINNTTGIESNNYGDYTTQSNSISQGATATVNITYSTGYTYDTKIWVDWNNDYDFDDAGEEVYSGTSVSSNPTTLVANFTVPVGASLGNHRMRIGGQDNGPCTPCYTGTYGTYEDYTINVTVAVPMAFSSCTTTQTNVTSVSPGATSQDILGVQVVTTGVSSPLTASSFTFNTNGSSSASNIANAKLWATGTSSTFATTIPLGSATVTPSGSFTITGGTNMPYTLESGTNYFWLTYDIVASPTLHDVVDAECTSVTVSSARTPTITAPSGSRPIEIVFCTPTYSSGGSSDNITHVVLEGLDDTPPDNNSPYYFDRTTGQNTVPTLNNSETHTLSVTLGTEGNQYSRVWVDFNQNGTFEASESFSTGTNAGSGGSANISIVVPAGALSGQTLMRIRGGEDNAITDAQACGASSSSYGQALDYYVNITPAVNMSYVSCTSTQSNTNVISTGSQNQEIICMKVVTSGSLNPISVTEFRMRTDGSTNYSTDLRNAKIWFTGTESTFSTSDQFGSTMASPLASGSDMVFTDSQVLAPGTNYFWLTYDIPSTATNGNFADATFQSVVVAGTTQTPTVSQPGGNREIIRGCFYTLTLKDDYGSGWDDNLLTVKVNGVTRLNNVTFGSGYTSTYQFIAETGQTITTEYTAGTNASDKSYFITNPNGAYVSSSGEAQTIPDSISVIADCNAVKQFTTNVDTYQSGTSCFILTEAKEGQKGSVWSNYKIDMTESFSIEFELYLGDDDGGADGVVFALQGSCTSAGGNGNSMGFGGISNSLGVEFDTYTNSQNSDLSADHIAIISNGSANHGGSDNLAGPLGLSDMEDGAWHSARVSWNATNHIFKIKYGSDSLTYTGDIVTDLFAGNSQVFWGFTGATGWYYNTQKVCVTSYPQNSTQVRDTTINAGTSVNVQAATGASSYTWIPDDGSVSNTTIPNPVLTPTVTTEYTCLLEDGCGKMITNKFTVQVISTLPLVLEDFTAVCQSTGVELRWQTASEHNNDYFVLERSTDLIHYTEIAQIQGAANSTSINEYHFTDLNAYEVNYYRLSQVDFDGKRTYFNPIASDCSTAAKRLESIPLYPNPASEWFSLGLPVGVVAKIQILNIAGMIVSERNEVTSVSQIDVRILANGVYMVKVMVGDDIYYCKMNKH